MTDDSPIPYTVRDSLPTHALRWYRYRCTKCKKSATYWLPPALTVGTSHLPAIGCSPKGCALCGSTKRPAMILRNNVNRRKK